MGGRGASSMKRKYDGKISLQGIGQVDAREAINLKKGDILLWNGGYTSKVTGVEISKTGKTLNVTTKSSESGNIYKRKFNANRLVGIAEKEARTYQDRFILSLKKGKK